MFQLLECAFWGLFHWQLLEETFGGGSANDCQKLVLSKWVRVWEKDSIEKFKETVKKIDEGELGFTKFAASYFGC